MQSSRLQKICDEKLGAFPGEYDRVRRALNNLEHERHQTFHSEVPGNGRYLRAAGNAILCRIR